MRACVLVVSLVWAAAASAATSLKAEVEGIAKKVVAEQAKQLDFDEGLLLRDQVARFKQTNADKGALASELSSQGAALAALGANPALTLSLGGSAVARAPEDPHVVANFGELLHQKQLLREAVKVLSFARTLAPKSVVVITNLGNTYWDLKRPKEAERAWRDAIALDDAYGPAHEGMVALYLSRPDVPRALEHLFRASQFTFVPSMSNAARQAQVSGSTAAIPPPPGVNPKATQTGAGASEQPRVGPGEILVIPDLPNWPDRMAFVGSMQGLQPMLEDIVTGGLGGGAAFAERYYGGGEGARPAGPPRSPLSQKPLFELELMNMYVADQLQRALGPYGSKGETASKKMAQGIEQAGAAWLPKIQQATARGDYDEAKRAMASCSRAGRVVADKFFAEWRDATREAWSRSKQSLELYWIYTDGILGRIHDQESFEFAQNVRKTTVKLALLPLAVGMTSQLTGMAIADVMCLAPGDSAPPVAPPQPPAKLVVPDKQMTPCPADKLPTIPFGIGSVTVRCDKWEAEVGQGVMLKIRREFKTGAMTVLVGVGVQSTGIGIDGSARAMVGVSVDGQGNLTHVVGEVGAGLGAGLRGVTGEVGVGTSISVDLAGHVKIDAPSIGVGVNFGSDAPEEPGPAPQPDPGGGGEGQ